MEFWFDFLEEINNLQMSALCKDFEALSLENRGSLSYTSLVQNMSDGYRERFLHCCRSSPLSQSFIEVLRAYFIDIPRTFLDSLKLKKSDNLRMCFCFRYKPGQDQYIHDDLQLPKSFDRLTFLSNSLGLSLNKTALPLRMMYSWSSSGAGLRGLVNETNINKMLVEFITYSNGFYGRFIVLVCLGLGCTVWFALAPGSSDHAPVASTFTAFSSYEPFFWTEHIQPGFQKISFVETRDVSASVESALENEHPFAGITIPANGPVLKSVGLGLMVAIFLAVGIVPNLSSVINEQ